MKGDRSDALRYIWLEPRCKLHDPFRQFCRLRRRRHRHGADPQPKHGLSRLAFDLPGASRGARLARLGVVVLGFIVYGLFAAFGITALIFAIPYAYDALRVAGAAYLAYLAWRALNRAALRRSSFAN